MIHGAATRLRTHAPHAEALAGPGSALAGRPSPATTDDEAQGDVPEADAFSVLRLMIAVALIFAFGALAPMIAAAAR